MVLGPGQGGAGHLAGLGRALLEDGRRRTRVGLEDSIYLSKGTLAESNADQVAKIVRILRELSLEVATPAEARQLIALKGPENTAIPAGS